jgi:hypothetical protein
MFRSHPQAAPPALPNSEQHLVTQVAALCVSACIMEHLAGAVELLPVLLRRCARRSDTKQRGRS